MQGIPACHLVEYKGPQHRSHEKCRLILLLQQHTCLGTAQAKAIDTLTLGFVLPMQKPLTSKTDTEWQCKECTPTCPLPEQCTLSSLSLTPVGGSATAVIGLNCNHKWLHQLLESSLGYASCQVDSNARIAKPPHRCHAA